MAKNINLQPIPTYEDFLKGLEKIKEQQLEVRETSKLNKYPFDLENGEISTYGTGAITPKGTHYQITAGGDINFTKPTLMTYNQIEDVPEKGELVGKKGVYPPFSAAELLLESKDDFQIDYNKAANYYQHNVNLAKKEMEMALKTSLFTPSPLADIKSVVNQQEKEVGKLLDEKGLVKEDIEQIQQMLNNHYEKLERLMDNYYNKAKDTPFQRMDALQNELKQKVVGLFKGLKDSIDQKINYVKETANNTVSSVKTNTDNAITAAKITANNAVASRVQRVNDKIKDFSNLVDSKFKVIEKENKSNIVEVAKSETEPKVELAKNEAVKETPKTKGEEEREVAEGKELRVLRDVVTRLYHKHPEIYKDIKEELVALDNQEQDQNQEHAATKTPGIKRRNSEAIEL